MINVFFFILLFINSGTDTIENCELNDGRWDNVHKTCDGIDKNQCIYQLEGRFLQCKTSEYICPLDDPKCAYFVGCESTCLFRDSIKSIESPLETMEEMKTNQENNPIIQENAESVTMIFNESKSLPIIIIVGIIMGFVLFVVLMMYLKKQN